MQPGKRRSASGRIYHVVSSPDGYFGAKGEPLKIYRIREGGLGIWGAIVLGGVGAWIGCRRAGVRLPPFGDAVAPGIVLAQAIGRWGNWFNNELYGRVTDLPWGLRVYEMDHSTGRVYLNTDGTPQLMDNRDVFYHPHLPLREPLERRGLRRADLGGPQVPARARPAVRPVRRPLHRGQGLDRGPAGRPERVRPRAAAQHLDQRCRVPRRAGVPRRLPQAAAGAGDRPRPRDGRRAAAAAPGEGDPAAGTTAEGMVGSMSGSSGDAGTFRPGDPGTGSLGTGHDGAGRSGDGGSPGGSVPGAR